MTASKAKFIGLFVISLVLCVAVLAAFWGPFSGAASQSAETPSPAVTDPSGRGPGSLPADSTAYYQKQINAADVSDAERSLRSSLDSLHGGSSQDQSAQVTTTLNLFREAIKNPRAISIINEALTKGGKPGTGNKEEVAKLKDELLVKEGQLVSLQNQLKAAQGTGSSSAQVTQLRNDIQAKDAQIVDLQNKLKAAPKETGSNPQAIAKMKDDLQSKDAQIAKLMTQLKARPDGGNTSKLMEENKKLADENSFLKWAVRSEVSSNHNLTNLNSSLKQANASLQSQVNELKKSGN